MKNIHKYKNLITACLFISAGLLVSQPEITLFGLDVLKTVELGAT